MNESKISVSIDEQFRFTLFGLQCVLDVNFSSKEIERIFSEARDDQVSEKKYDLFRSQELYVTGYVEEYEPESITLVVRSKKNLQNKLDVIHENAGFEIYRMKQPKITSR